MLWNNRWILRPRVHMGRRMVSSVGGATACSIRIYDFHDTFGFGRGIQKY